MDVDAGYAGAGGRRHGFDLLLTSDLIPLADMCHPRCGLHLVCARWRIRVARLLHAHRTSTAHDVRWLSAPLSMPLPERHRLPISRAAAARISFAKQLIDPDSLTEGWKTHGVHSLLDQWARETVRAIAGELSVPHVRETSWDRNVIVRDTQDVLVPFMIKGFASDWPAVTRWDPSSVFRNRCVSPSLSSSCLETSATTSNMFSCHFRCGDLADDSNSDGAEDEVTVSLSDLFEYFLSQQDDDPLYVFDRKFADANRCPSMLDDYHNNSGSGPDRLRAALYPDDLMAHMQTKRPPHRWFLCGPRGSGTAVHRDPPGTLAWNALLKGCKIWALLDPRMTPHEARCGDEFWHSDLPSASWFKDYFPEVVKQCPEGMTVQFAVQCPGDVLVIPPNWWHAVWNVEDTIAVTENGVSLMSFYREVFGRKNEESIGEASALVTEVSGGISIAGRLDTEDEELVKRVEAVFGLEDRAAAAQWLKQIKMHFSENPRAPP